MIEFIGAISEEDLAKADKDTIAMIKSQALVRCRDCEYGIQDQDGTWICRGFGCQVGDDDGSGFCANAERREK